MWREFETYAVSVKSVSYVNTYVHRYVNCGKVCYNATTNHHITPLDRHRPTLTTSLITKIRITWDTCEGGHENNMGGTHNNISGGMPGDGWRVKLKARMP